MLLVVKWTTLPEGWLFITIVFSENCFCLYSYGFANEQGQEYISETCKHECSNFNTLGGCMWSTGTPIRLKIEASFLCITIRAWAWQRFNADFTDNGNVWNLGIRVVVLIVWSTCSCFDSACMSKCLCMFAWLWWCLFWLQDGGDGCGWWTETSVLALCWNVQKMTFQSQFLMFKTNHAMICNAIPWNHEHMSLEYKWVSLSEDS